MLALQQQMHVVHKKSSTSSSPRVLVVLVVEVLKVGEFCNIWPGGDGGGLVDCGIGLRGGSGENAATGADKGSGMGARDDSSLLLASLLASITACCLAATRGTQ